MSINIYNETTEYSCLMFSFYKFQRFKQTELLIPLWIQTTKPYIEVIDEWITNGNLVDPRAEFILKR